MVGMTLAISRKRVRVEGSVAKEEGMSQEEGDYPNAAAPEKNRVCFVIIKVIILY